MTKNKKHTKRALLAGVVSMLLCVSMLIGSTMAWFTDTAVSGINTIQAGNLDLVLEYKDTTTNTWKEVNANTRLFKQGALYEPGYTEYISLRVKNAGTLALKYQLDINVANKVIGKNEKGEDIDLSKYLVFGIKEDTQYTAYNRDSAREAIEYRLGLNSYSVNDVKLTPNQERYLTLVLYMPETVGNEANYRGDKIPSLDLGIKLLATQLVYESDSWDNTYDENATYPNLGDVNDYYKPGIDNTTEQPKPITEINIATADELMAFAQFYSAGKLPDLTTVNITADIDLNGKAWTPIYNGYSENLNTLSINGNSHTISNMNVYGKESLGFFGESSRNLAIANLTFTNASVTTTEGSYAGVVIGKQFGGAVSLTKVDVNNSTVKSYAEDGRRLGGLVGLSSIDDGASLTIDGCNVNNITVSGNKFVAGMVGTAIGYKSANANNFKVINSSVKNSTFEITIIDENSSTYISAVAVDSKDTSAERAFTNDAVNFSGIVGENSNNEYKWIDPYLVEIETADDLFAFASDVNVGKQTFEGYTVKLMNDINLQGRTWTPIGQTGKTSFAGIFDGNGFAINNMYVDTTNETDEYYSGGLFGWLEDHDASGVTIKNLTINNATVISNAWAGGIVGYLNGGANQLIDNCKVTNSNIEGGKNDMQAQAGGIVGHLGTGKITNCQVNNTTVSTLSIKDYTQAGIFAGWVATGASVDANNCTSSNSNAYSKTLLIYTADDLVEFEQSLNKQVYSYDGQTIMLMSDIDLAGIDWNPIGQTGNSKFKGTFDGNNKTIKNLSVDSSAEEGANYASGLFGWLEGGVTIKNLTVDGANVVGHHNVAVVAGYAYAKIENCHVKNATVISTHVNDDACGDKVGLIVGYLGEDAKIDNCTGSNSTITVDGRDAGQIVGAVRTVNVTNCSANNVIVKFADTITCNHDSLASGGNVRNEVIGRIL